MNNMIFGCRNCRNNATKLIEGNVILSTF